MALFPLTQSQRQATLGLEPLVFPPIPGSPPKSCERTMCLEGLHPESVLGLRLDPELSLGLPSGLALDQAWALA